MDKIHQDGFTITSAFHHTAEIRYSVWADGLQVFVDPTFDVAAKKALKAQGCGSSKVRITMDCFAEREWLPVAYYTLESEEQRQCRLRSLERKVSKNNAKLAKLQAKLAKSEADIAKMIGAANPTS